MYSNKDIWSVSYPILLSLLAQNIINVTDTAFLGHVGEIALGASAMGGLFYLCVFIVAFGFSSGAQILMARRNGEGRHEEVGPIMKQGVLFLLILALSMFVLTKLLGGTLMKGIVSSPAIYDSTMEFLDWRVYGFFFSSVNVMFRAFFIGITRTKVLTLNAGVMALVNVVLDYGLIFGKLGMPALGIKGAAIASVLAEASSVCFLLLYTYYTVDLKKYGLNRSFSFNPQLLKHMLSVSSFMMLQYLLSMGTWFVFFVAVERLGEHELAIANIVRSIYMILLIPVHALSTTCNSLVSNLIGSGGTDRVLHLIRKIALFSLSIMLVLVTLTALFPQQLLLIYSSDESLINGSITSIYVISLGMLLASVSGIVFNGISGTGNTQAALWLEMGTLIAYGAFIVVVAIILRASVAVCFTTEILYYSVLLIASLIYLHKAKWQHKTI